MDNQLDISIERVKKLNHPLLVIGLGGSGADMVRTIKDTFAERYILPRDNHNNPIPVPEKTAYLVFDTDVKSQSGFDSHEYVNISYPGLDSVLIPEQRDHHLTDYERRWINKNLNAASAGIGAGTYRQAARLMLSRNIQKVLPAISNTLQSLASMDAGKAQSGGRINVVICTGLCGGTGSGTFLDVAQIVRQSLKENPALNALKFKITGYLVMPDLSINAVKDTPALVDVLEHNGYAALKELDFWMRVGEHQTPYTMQYDQQTSISWTMPPFDACIMLSGTTVDGNPYTKAYEVMQKTVAENLLHYLADEAPPTNGNVPYTYISYEDNLKAVVTSMNKRLPLFYGYRAIGAYTKRIPKKKVLYYEGSKVFGTFIPQRDDNGHLVPHAALLTDGQSGARAAAIVGDLPSMYGNFQTRVPLPPYCNADPRNKAQLEQLRAMTNPLPHERAEFGTVSWLGSAIKPACIKEAEGYLDSAWARFEKLAKDVITDPQLGPFSLLAYLTDVADGLMFKMSELENSWNSMANSFATNVSAKLSLCKSAWSDFCRPPLLGAQKAIDLYLQGLRDFYDTLRKVNFVSEYARALTLLNKRMEDYVRDSLRPLCDDLVALEGEFTRVTANNGGDQIESDIFQLSRIQGTIDAEFALNNADNKISKEFLGDLCNASLATIGNVDRHSSGVSFTYKAKRSALVLDLLRQSLALCFGGINNQSLDAIMLQTAGPDLAAQQQYMDELGMSVLDSAKPMFAQKPAFAAETVAKYSYLSVPSDAPKHLERFEQSMKANNVQPKASSIRDHLYCVTSYDGLPLYRYNQIDALEATYWSHISNTESSMGMHLVWDGDIDSDYTTNWTKLPSPCPYYFFSNTGAHHAMESYRKVHALVERAIRCGMLVVDSSGPKPSYQLNFHFIDAKHVTYKAAETIIAEASAIRNVKDPVTGGPLQPQVVYDRLKDYLATAAKRSIICNQSPACLAPTLGLADQPCDPWDSAIQANPAIRQQALQNHLLLCKEMASAMISMYPMYISALERQLPGVEYIKGELDAIEGESKIWLPRLAFADTYAKLWIYGLIFPTTTGMAYRNAAGERVSLLQESLLKADIRAEGDLIKFASHLGDLDEQNPLRYELQVLLQENIEAVEKREAAGVLTVEQIQVLRDKAHMLVEQCTGSKNQVSAAKRSPNADHQRINSMLELLNAISNTAGNISASLQMVQMSLR